MDNRKVAIVVNYDGKVERDKKLTTQEWREANLIISEGSGRYLIMKDRFALQGLEVTLEEAEERAKMIAAYSETGVFEQQLFDWRPASAK